MGEGYLVTSIFWTASPFSRVQNYTVLTCTLENGPKYIEFLYRAYNFIEVRFATSFHRLHHT